MHRARLKPRGYPGDYQLLAAIYDGTPKSRGLGGYLDLYFLNTTLGWAVKTRLQAVRRFLIEEVSHRRGNVSILNVACGPCREYREGLNAPEEGALHVTCLDSDQEALDYVRAHAAEMPGIHRLDCTCYNALRMSSSKANVAKFGRPDIIYSVGLCDYIPDKYLVAMLRGWRESLGEGGVVYVAFKDCRRYDKTEYQWMVDWFFLQRTEEECRGLFEQAGYDPGALEMARDESGVIMNFVSRSKADRLFRIDQSGAQRAEHSPSVAVPHLDKTSGSAAPKEAV
ncbi:MAG: class I SAM-dependent methyltransferase [Pirellulales bacterium]|nr:class I SAM-dependent methyltransferase [Pirellulales bacterium]